MKGIPSLFRKAVRCFLACGLALATLTTALASNPISIENALNGNARSEWDISGAGDLSIQGFATEISVNKGQTVYFKVKTNASAYRIDIYRLGYYQGLGARRVDRITPSAALPQAQPDPISDPSTGLVDCGNWAISASWNVPANATSGVYIGKLVRSDTGGASHIVFVVRDDASTSDLLFQTSDTTWQAYNTYGGNSFYVGAPAGRAYKVSYNRPFITRSGSTSYDWLFSAEYPMIRWLEANGYHVSYSTGVDTDRRGALLRNHRVFLSVGHDEYWSGQQRANVEAARGAGVNLAFFNGNAMFWKTRWEPAIDGSGTPYRTLVCYKETHAGAKIDPSSQWTGTWRDPRFSPPSDGGRPENALMGTIFMVNGHRNDAISVPASYGAHRFWRNTSVAALSGTQVATFAAGTLGYEWDEAPQNGWQPPGLMRLSSTTVNNVPLLRDYGSTYSSGTATHSLSLYRHSSGALVFGAGTVQWSWGLDATHDNASAAADVRIQQATVNLFADMGTVPATLRSGLTQTSQSSDSVLPVSTIQTPASGQVVQPGSSVEITGTASDVGGQVWGVEVSVDGGTTWRPASGRGSWSFSWVPSAGGQTTIKSRAYDDSGNMETPSSGVSVTVAQPSFVSIWPASATPTKADQGPDSPVELGVKFRSDVAGVITGIRFYKAAGNTGTHIGSLWSSTGTRMAWATFIDESASGWQQVNFSTPVSITANTVYVASYHCPAGHYSADEQYFATSGVNSLPLRALANGVSGGNGVYRYGSAGTFPNQSWNSANYWVDVMFEPTLNSITVSPANPSVPTGSTQQFTATGSYADGSTRDVTSRVTWSSSNTAVASIESGGLATAVGAGSSTIRAALGNVSGTSSLTVIAQPLSITTASLPAGSLSEAYSAGLAANGGTLPRTWSVASGSLPPGVTLNTGSGAISGTPTASGTFNFTAQVRDASTPVQTATKALSITVAAPQSGFVSIWPASTTPTNVDEGPDRPVELGVKFRSDVAGVITGIRFYKAAGNTGTHIGSLWSSTGTRMAWATFIDESASGWQQVNFSTPVSITANTVYVASYHCPAGHYSLDEQYFAASGADNPPLHLLANGVSGGNGVFRYGSAGTFPNQSWNSANYWVDVMFEPTSGADTLRPTVVATTPRSGMGGIAATSVVTATFSEAINASTLNSSTLSLLNESNQVVPAAVSYDSTTRTATLTPNVPLSPGATYLAIVKGGTSGVADLAGNRMAADVLWSFTTATYGALTGGPGGPVLVITDESNPFSRYYAEILLAEGLNHFAIKDISEVSATTLATVDAVILGSIALTNAQVTMFTNWVTQGGNLIAMRPDKKLAGLLGLSDTGSTLAEGYLLVDTSSGPGGGIVGETIQFHGVADRYTLTSATRVATLYANAQTATANPAVTLREVGSNGGQAAAFTFDLARSVVLTRQGNPAWVGQERDGFTPLRTSDLFYGAASGDPQPDWINLNKVAIPQADEQQRLLANLITVMSADRKLLPRFWYFPHGHEAAVVMTGDDHGKNGTKGRFDSQLDLSDENGSVDDWETVRSTSYIYVNANAVTDAEAAAYTASGFELALHLNTGCKNYTRESLDTFFAQQLGQWSARYPSLTSPSTHRIHCLVWNGYTILPEVEAKYGIRLDVNYYYWPPNWVANRPGFMTGSGLPMRFATVEGNVLDVYQAATQMTDESGQSYPFTINQLLDKAQGPEGFYGAFVANMHTDEQLTPDYTSLVLAAVDRGVPVISARQLLTWTDARNSSSIAQIQSNASSTTFTVQAGSAARGLKVMLPLPAGAAISSVRYNGQGIPYQLRVIKGVQYAFLDARSGGYEVSFAADSTAPTVTSIVPAGGSNGVPINTQVQVTFSEPVNAATLAGGNLVLRDSSNVAVSAELSYSSNTNTATLTPAGSLRSGVVYTLTVKGGAGGVADVSGNPMASNFVSTFTTAAGTGTLHTIWPDTTVPAVLADGDRKAVELGVKFRASVNGRIRGIRFYKSSSNTDVHVGNLWTQNGALLGSVTFRNESASGWQYQEFATPIAVTADTTYIASYHTRVGRYSITSGYFNTGFGNGPLRALSSAEGGGNGVYRYGSGGVVPNETFNATNYWVDVVFESN